MTRPFSEACEQNKFVIYDAIESFLTGEVLEIGSGTGQHAVFFAAQKPDILWQTSDVAENLAGIASWIDDSGLDNLPPPIELDVTAEWPATKFDFVFSANSFHIMGRSAVAACISGIGRCLKSGAAFAVYGPFNYGGHFTSDSNARFDQMLKSRDPSSGIKDFEWVDQLAKQAGLILVDDIEMPANNRSLVWQKRTL